MNIDFIKWMVEKAEGFEFINDPEGDWVSFGTGYTLDPKDILLFTGEVLYPLLLQRAIEGVNREEESDFDIDQYADCTEVGCYSDGALYRAWWIDQMTDEHDLLTPDQAKEEALKHIYKQEEGNDQH